MSTKGMYTLREDKQELTKQLGCMNGIFQLFDRRHLLGQKKLSQGGKKEINNESEKPNEKMANEKHRASVETNDKHRVSIEANEKHRVSVESSRNSFTSSCSSMDCSKRVQTELSSSCPSIISEPLSPTVTKENIKNVVKNSMTRKPRVVPVKTVAKDVRKGPTMTHIDSPRPVPYDRKDQNLEKLKEISKASKEISRFSCDGRESIYKLKSIANIKDMPRFSLDSKQSSIKNNKNTHDNELVTNKRPSSSVIARLMGLEALNDVINGGESLKIKTCVDDISVSLSRSPSNTKMASPRIPLEPAPWKQEGGTPKERKKVRDRVDHGGHSVYGQIEKRLTDVEFKSSGKDLRALKQILEAIQRTKMRLEKTENQKIVPPDSMVITNAQKVKNVKRIDGRRSARNLTPIETKAKKPVSPSRNSGTVSPRIQRSKNGNEKQPVRGVRKQSKGQLCNYSSHIRNLSQQSDISFISESDTSVASQNEPEVTSKDWSERNKNKFAERLIDYKPMAEQPSPVSVLDAFYTEETLSPVKKKSYTFKDDEDLHFDEQEWSQVGIDNLAELNHPSSGVNTESIKHLIHQIELLNTRGDEATVDPHENEDQIYIKEILLTSGFFKNLDCATTIVHLHPTGSLINPEMFNILEKTRNYHGSTSSKSEKMRRKMLFDSINDILVQILSKRKRSILNGENILKELWSEINKLQSNKGSEEYDEILNIITMDVNRKSEDWDENSNEVPDLALDIERLIFKDLISEIVNNEVGSLQNGPGKHCRQLFLM